MQIVDGAPDFAWLATEGPSPTAHSLTEDGLGIAAGPRTDWFVDPSGVHEAAGNAPILLAPLGAGPDGGPAAATFAATASCDGTSTFDAATLYVFVHERSWGKLALERDPVGRWTLVSVVTDSTSDDCNPRPVQGPARLRVTSVGGGAFAFHVHEGGRWELLRLFGLRDAKAEPDAVRLGLSAQSPLGGGCSGTFRDLVWSTEVPADLRDGS